MRMIVLQHLPCEHPGIFRQFMEEDGVEVLTVDLSTGEPLPHLRSADALLVFGGPMNVYEEERYPWLAAETASIREAALAGMPVIGVCLGAQLLAKSLGATVTRNPDPEVGLLDIELNQAGLADPLFRGWPRRAPVVQWHSDTFALPDGGVLLASSAACAHQAFRFGETAYGLQFHPEVTAEMVMEWSDIPEYASAMEKITRGSGTNPFHRVAPMAAELTERARLLYRNFLQLAVNVG